MPAGQKNAYETRGARLFRVWVDDRVTPSKSYFVICGEIAADLDTTQTTVYRWYDGRSIPAVRKWAQLESYTEVPAIAWSQRVEPKE